MTHKAKSRFLIAAFFVLLIVTIMIGGGIFRGEISPWFWEQYSVDAARHGQGDALFGAVLYLLFYAIGFAAPYSILSAVIELRYTNKKTDNELLVDESALRTAVFLTSFGCLLSFILLLNAEAASLRALLGNL